MPYAHPPNVIGGDGLTAYGYSLFFGPPVALVATSVAMIAWRRRRLVAALATPAVLSLVFFLLHGVIDETIGGESGYWLAHRYVGAALLPAFVGALVAWLLAAIFLGARRAYRALRAGS